MTATIADICRYPVKGLTDEHLERVALAPGEGLPHDRRFALAHGSTRFDPAAPKWMPKTNFLTLMRDERLAQLRARFDPESRVLTIERAGRPVVRADATTPTGRALIGQFFAGFMGDSARGAPRLVEASGHMFSDTPPKVVSIVNLASVRDLERVVRRPVDPIRFRANVYLDGVAPWAEFNWIGGEIALVGARLRVDARINRCAATNVDPETAARDMNIPRILQAGFGHVDMGIYAAVIAGGDIGVGDSLTAPAP